MSVKNIQKYNICTWVKTTLVLGFAGCPIKMICWRG